MKKVVNITRLKEILEEKNILGKDLATDLNLSAVAISNAVQGKSLPRPENLLKIANYLDVDLKDLFISTKKTEKTEKEEIFIKRGNAYLPIGDLNIQEFPT